MKKRKKKKNIFIPIIFIISSFYFIRMVLLFEKIENTIRYLIITLIILFDLFEIIRMITNKKRHTKYSFLLVVFSIIFVFIGYNLNKIYSYFSDLNKNIIISTSIVTLKENKNVDLNTIKDLKIGINEYGNHNLSQELLDKYDFQKNNDIKKYDGYHEMIIDLYNKEIDFIIIPTNYEDVFGSTEEFNDIDEKIIILDTLQDERKKEENKNIELENSFTILLIGIDSTKEGFKNVDSFNGDSLILVTFNKETLKATMLSIPRDSYVPIYCFSNKKENKITHAAANGTECVIKTIEEYFDIDINYYMKINFTGIVDLVNALNGIEVDVPYSFCEQNSKRQFGKNTIYVKKGIQTLDGEQALALSRNRKSNKEYCGSSWAQGNRSDFVRSENQQKVIEAILNKVKTLSTLDDFKSILEVISKNIDTNMEEKTIFSFYDLAKEILINGTTDRPLVIEKLFLDGTGQMIYDEKTKLVLWDYVINKKSKNEVIKAMKNNLEGEVDDLIKDEE